MKTVLRDLVKKHFNLVDAPAVTEEEVKVEEQLSEEVVENQTEENVEETLSEKVTESTFAEIKTADGELTLTYEGEIGEGVAIFVITEDGNIPAPDGTHALEGGITISTEGGVITAISEEEVEAEEHEEEMSEEIESTEEEFEGESSEVNINELHEALIQMLGEEFKTQISTLKEEFNAEIKAVREEFGAQPAAEKTITNKKQTYGRSNSVDISYNPTDKNKKAQFERLLKARKRN